MTLEDMVNLAVKQAEQVLVGTKEQLVPSWLLVDGEGKVEIFATPWSNWQEKQLTVGAMRLIMRKHGTIAYSLLVETWYAHATAEEVKQKEYVGPPPSERPDRQEAVAIMAANREGQTTHRMFEIIRKMDGRCRELRRLDGPEDSVTSGLFDNLLDNKRRAN